MVKIKDGSNSLPMFPNKEDISRNSISSFLINNNIRGGLHL
jgi:hypothetical protein